MESSSQKGIKILYLNFNQDYSSISIGTSNGYIIYNVSPFKEIYRKSKLKLIL